MYDKLLTKLFKYFSSNVLSSTKDIINDASIKFDVSPIIVVNAYQLWSSQA